jgi:hypothetical protein
LSKAAEALATGAVKRRDPCRLLLLVESGRGPFDRAPSKGATFAGFFYLSPGFV